MSLTSCKECKKEIYAHAETCPHCGVKEPGVSYAEENKLNEIKQQEEHKEYYLNLVEEHSKGVFHLLFSGSTRKECTERADIANNNINELNEELAILRNKETT